MNIEYTETRTTLHYGLTPDPKTTKETLKLQKNSFIERIRGLIEHGLCLTWLLRDSNGGKRWLSDEEALGIPQLLEDRLSTAPEGSLLSVCLDTFDRRREFSITMRCKSEDVSYTLFFM